MASSSSRCHKHNNQTNRYRDACTRSTANSADLGSVMESQSIQQTPRTKLDFANLGLRSLLRYWRRYNLGSRSPNLTKDELATAVQEHFLAQSVDEEQTILEFIWTAKRLKTDGTQN